MSPTDKVKLDQLPSKTEFYDKFNGAQWIICNSTIGGAAGPKIALESNFNAYSGFTSLAGKFMGAYCYACEEREKNESKTEQLHLKNAPCQFFYHWVGDQVFMTTDRPPVSKVLGAIYATLGTFSTENKCELKYKDVDQELHDHRKTAFNYYYDYKDVLKYLTQDDRDCLKHWSTYKQGVTEACTKVKEYCDGKGKDNNDTYCTWFNSKGNGEDYCGQKLKELECKPVTAAAAKQGVDMNSSVSIPAISSTVGTLVGLPSVFYFLYKHTPLFSGLRNHSFGHNNNRRKRGALRRNFDTLTQYTMENGSTTGSTTVDSTVGDLTDNSTVCSSAPYTTTASTKTGRTGRTSNSRQQQSQHRQRREQQHQRNGERRRNIAYHRM